MSIEHLDTEEASRTTDKTKNYVVYEDLARASGPKVHHVGCFYYQRWLSSRTTTTTWHGPYSYEEAWETCRRIASETAFEPSEHSCVERFF